MVIFLVALVAMILMRTLKKDFAKFNKDIDDFEDPAFAVGEESGWKQVSGDVFRQPPYLALFSALIGIHLFVTLHLFPKKDLERNSLCLCSAWCLFPWLSIISILSTGERTLLASTTKFGNRHGTIVTSFVVLYSLTSFIAGYVSGSYYKKNNGKDWVWCMILTASVFPVFVFSTAFLLNFIALSYDSLAHIPFGTMMIVCFSFYL